MRRAIVFLILLAAIPVADAAPTQATTSTGDVDAYNDDVTQICGDAFTDWTVTLTLAPSPEIDVVALVVDAHTSGVGVAGVDGRTAVVYARTSNTCPPLTEVIGVFVGSGELAYTVEWVPRGGVTS